MCYLDRDTIVLKRIMFLTFETHKTATKIIRYRSFLGHDHESNYNTTNWEVTCALKCNGGLGILDLDRQNEALLLKWIWWIQHHPEG